MAIHLTPEELSDALGMDSREIVRLCREESVPILVKIAPDLTDAEIDVVARWLTSFQTKFPRGDEE